MYSRLFQSLKIGPRETRNRILFGSHTTNLAHHNLLSQQHADYYAARAEGGAGIVVLEEHIVHTSDMPYESAVLGYLPATAQAVANVAERVHAHGALALVQLNHNGQQSTSYHHQREMWAPSPVPDVASREVPKAMEKADIRAVIDGFAQVARTVTQAGADGVELQVADRSLLRQFLSPLTNQRSDTYGGALENRLRFVQETLEAVHAAIGTSSVLGMRFCADELAPWAGLTPEQGLEIAHLLTTTGRINYLTVTMGSIFSTHMFPFHASMHVPPGYTVHLASAIKAAVDVPVFAAGRIMTAAQAERVLAEGQADGVEMIRALIADPNLPRLSQAGHAGKVRPCIACNQGCQVRGEMNATISCNVNPDVIHAQPLHPSGGNSFPVAARSPLPVGARVVRSGGVGLYGRPLVPPNGDKPKSGQQVYIIGGGPAGLEAARTAAQRGQQVILYEREATLGGTVPLAARGPGRGELQLITGYLQSEVERLGVEMRTGVEVTAAMILAQQPHTVIVATGAHTGPGLLPIPGHNLPHVTDVRRVLAGELLEGQRVVVIDETASHGVLSAVEMLAMAGKSVELVTGDFYAGRDLVPTHDIVLWKQRVLPHYVIITPHTSVVRIEPGQVIVVDRFAEGERALPADAVVLGTYERPSQELYMALKGRVPRLFRIGDCVAPRRIEQAILEGRQVGDRV
jgi:2,4-dienoyl-CoA reductase-like NADH-dependent reductase (Old Yellow Enzyme family)/NADPH-dependent 2,4-dienoyl-CoA reductase/sulfur reductase-like enzyme